MIAFRKAPGVMCLAVAYVALSARADETALGQALLDVGTDLRLMCVAAHPDDEDGATLTLYRKKYGYETYAVIGTRGEGGQNEIGPELYEELGVIRTFEMMRAAEITGAQLRFLNLPEFGYSKTADETFEKWGREETLRRLVRVIREVKPDVIITNHGAAKDHGHHQALGAALVEAFDAAADPAAFPDLADTYGTWQPARLYRRESNGVEIDINQRDPRLGVPYSEIAARALEQHRSQGMGFFIDRLLGGKHHVTYRLVKESADAVASAGPVPAPGGVLFDGLGDRVTARERELSKNPPAADRLVEPLLSLAENARAAHAAALAMGLDLDVAVDDATLVPGQQAKVRVSLVDAGTRDVRAATFRMSANAWTTPTAEPVSAKADAASRTEATLAFTVPDGQPVTLPWPDHLFDDDFLEPQLTVLAQVDCGTGTLTLTAPVRFDVAPRIGLRFDDAPYLARLGPRASATFRLRVTNYTPDPVEATVILSPSSGFRSLRNWNSRRLSVSLDAEDKSKIIELEQKVQQDVGEEDLYLTALVSGQEGAVHGRARLVDVRVPDGIRVGVIQSYDDTLVRVLDRLGVPHETLDEDDLTPKKLRPFTTVLVDIRAYLARPDLVARNAALLKYVSNGGTVIVQYQKTFEWKPSYAPYPIHVSRNRVTVEEAPIEILEPGHPVFNVPNAIAPEDWNGWIQERGLYFPSKWDDRYTPLIACSDPGEDIPPGSLLIARHGRGTYVYTALVWYRQLRELHPGALRMFANMLALGAKEG